MRGRYRVIISPRVFSDIAEIHTYIEIEQQSPQNARLVVARLLEAIDSLENFPRRFAIYGGIGERSEKVRRMAVWPFLIYYRIDEPKQLVEIISIRHGSRLPPTDF